MAIADYYKILGIKYGATPDEIKKAYYRIAKRHHPDKNPNNKSNEDYFKQVSEAYNTLSDIDARKKYDLRFFYSSSQGSKQNAKTQANKTSYTKRNQHPVQKANKWIVILPVTFISIIIIMFIINPKDDETKMMEEMMRKSDSLGKVRMQPQNIIIPADTNLKDADSPYDSYFGGGYAEDYSKSTITVNNNNTCEVIVCLVQKADSDVVMRNEYISANSAYNFRGVPNGEFYLKAYFGKKWHHKKMINNNTVKGAFSTPLGFYATNKKQGLFVTKQYKQGDNKIYTNYEIELNSILGVKEREISETDYFRK